MHFSSNSLFEVELSIQSSNFIVIVITEKGGKFIIKEQAIRIFVLKSNNGLGGKFDVEVQVQVRFGQLEMVLLRLISVKVFDQLEKVFKFKPMGFNLNTKFRIFFIRKVSKFNNHWQVVISNAKQKVMLKIESQ